LCTLTLTSISFYGSEAEIDLNFNGSQCMIYMVLNYEANVKGFGVSCMWITGGSIYNGDIIYREQLINATQE
jgi:hypothetical protein